MNVTFDVDGVLADFSAGFCGVLKDLYGIELDPTACKSWHWSDWADGLTKEMEDQAWDAIFSDPRYRDFWADLGSFMSTEDVRRINKLSENHIVSYVTNRSASGQHKDVRKVTAQWLRHQGIRQPLVFLARSGEKGRRSAALGTQIAIEDNGDNCVDYLDNGIGVAVLRRPYNEGYIEQIRVRGGYVVDMLPQFLDLLEGIEVVQREWVRGQAAPA